MAVNANDALFHAAIHDSLGGAEAALKAGADVDFKHVAEDISAAGTALYVASMAGHVDIVRLLLRKGASVAERSSSFAPLHAAAMKGWTEVVELLVQHGATVDIRDRFQCTPLMYACSYKHVDTVRRLIEFGARPDPLDGYIADRLRKTAGNIDEGTKLVLEARKSKLLRCCNPKCGKPGYRKTGTLKLCAGCKLTRYCSRDCQKQHWSVGHKKCCGHDVYSDEQEDPFEHWVSLMEGFAQKHGSELCLKHIQQSLKAIYG